MEFATIGVYGTCEDSFFAALEAFRTSHFFDIRMRRGLRGTEYAFVNAKRLEARIGQMGIEYAALSVLAPTQEIREIQRNADAKTGDAQRGREQLSDEFVRAYREQIAKPFGWREFLVGLPSNCRGVFFCVERSAAACHRSIVAKELSAHTAKPIKDITP